MTSYRGFQKKIASYGKLKKDWNSYGADAISDVVVKYSRMVLSFCSTINVFPKSVMPTGDGSILFLFEANNKQILLDVYSDSIVSLVDGKVREYNNIGVGDNCLDAAWKEFIKPIFMSKLKEIEPKV